MSDCSFTPPNNYYYQGYLHTKNGVLLNELDTFLYSRSSRLTSQPFLNTFHWSTSLKNYFARSWLWSIKETVYGKSILTNTGFRNRDNLETSWISVNLVKDNDNNELQ